ncbi:MAG: hypothetical protein RI973_1907, partial [Bacteroidota bacterium]
AAGTNPLCSTGTGFISVTANGGTAPLQYSLNGGNPQSFSSFSSLQAGAYSVQVTDANGCEVTTAIVNITTPTALEVQAVATAASCNGEDDGTVTVTATGGTGAYEYKIGTGTYSSTSTFTGLAAGTHVVTVKDANECEATVSVTVSQPAAISAIAAGSNPVCSDGTGSITVTGITGGFEPYEFSIDGGMNYQTSNIFTNLASSDTAYTVTVKDVNGCTGSSNGVTITAPIAIGDVITTGTNPSCFGGTGSVTVTVPTGGTAPYTYSINGGAYQTSNVFNGLSAGTYTVTVKDANGCQASDTATITQPAAPLTVTATGVNLTCAGSANGSVSAVVTGGTPINGGYTYNWTLYLGPGMSIPVGNQSSQDNLGAGIFNLTVTDSNSCTATATVQITQPTSLVTNIVNIVHASCNSANGSATVAASGGTSPYSYAWGPNITQTTSTATGLEAGNYQVTIADANDCQEVLSFTINGATMDATATLVTSASCSNASDGQATLTITGGTTPVTYFWAGPNGSLVSAGVYSGSPLTISNLEPGVHSISVTDGANCTDTTSLNVTAIPDNTLPTALCKDITVNFVTSAVTIAVAQIDNGSSDNCGILTMSLSETTFDCSNLGVNDVTLTVTDFSGNSNSCIAKVTVIDPLPPTVVCKDITLPLTGSTTLQPAQVFDEQASGDNCGTITLTSITPSQLNCSNVGINLVTLVGTDAQGNTATCQATVTVEGPEVSVVTTPEFCVVTGGEIIITAENPGNLTIIYSADGGASYQEDPYFSGLGAGIYEVVVSFIGTDTCIMPAISVEVGVVNVTNTWTGAGDGVSWTDQFNWSLGTYPADCHDVVIPANTSEVILKNGEEGNGHTLDVQSGGRLTVEPGAVLNINE